MLSHDLARILLARRNNDVRVEVLVDDDPDSVREVFAQRAELRDELVVGNPDRVTTDEVVTYDPDADVVVIRAAYVVVGSLP